MNLIKKITAVLCGYIFFTGFIITSEASERCPESITIIGDSIASGYGLEGYEDGGRYSVENYGTLLSREYEIPDLSYFNYGIDGETTEGLLWELENGSYNSGLRRSDVIVVSIGGNDLLDAIIGENSPVFKNSGLDKFLNGEISIAELLADLDLVAITTQLSVDAQEKLEIFNENIPKIVKSLTEINPEAMIVLQTLYNPMNTGIEILDNLYGQTISSLNSGIYGLEGCVIADVNTAFAQSREKLIQNDFTHPNEKGHKLIFEVVKNTIDEEYSMQTGVELPAEKPAETTTIVTTTSPQTTTTPEVTTTMPDVTDEESVEDDEKKNNSADRVIPLIIMVIVIFILFSILQINKNRKI